MGPFRSMLIPTRGLIRKRTKRSPVPLVAGWLPWLHAPSHAEPLVSSYLLGKERAANDLSVDAGLMSLEDKYRYEQRQYEACVCAEWRPYLTLSVDAMSESTGSMFAATRLERIRRPGLLRRWTSRFRALLKPPLPKIAGTPRSESRDLDVSQ